MIRFYNGRLLSFKNGFEITDDEVWTNGSEIAFVGKNHDKKADREIDLNGNLLMPAFKNAHTHSAMTFARSLADDLPLQPWLYDMIFPMEAKLNESDIYTLSRLAFLEYLSSGISACFDMYYYPEAMAKASVDAGFRTVMCGAVNNFKESVSLLDEYYQKYNSYDELISYRLGFHAEYTTSKELMNGIALLAEKHEAPVFTHSSETKSEVDDCIERYGKTPTELFEELGLFNYGGGGFHSVWMSENDLEIYKKHGIWAVINAGSNSKLASGIAPLEKMQKAGINTAIGTDGPSSNNALDMFREMYLAAVTQKLKTSDAAACDAAELLKAATVGGAHCMGLYNCDIIDTGKKADLTVIDLHRPNMQPINNIIKNIVYSGSKENVKLTMINGKILYENGEFIGTDIEKIYYEVQKITDRLKSIL
ncbi:MAG: amidohydrolase [Clostridiales bacterium]|jgi:5-methylthioadenosine/S-adenosylhomocysteine deaminase|nr:amidohydrolase [Clostridiales bacterium]